MNIHASNATVQNLTIEGFNFGIEIDGMGGCVENVLVRQVTMNGGLNTVEVGSTCSNSTLRNIRIEECISQVAHEEWEEDAVALAALAYNISCGRYKQGGAIENCVLENVYVNKCRKVGQSRVGLNFVSGMPAGSDFTKQEASFNNLTSRNINITNNHFDLCWDGILNVVDSFLGVKNSSIDKVNITGNYGLQGIVAIYMYSGEPLYGTGGGGKITNVNISNNHFKVGIDDVGEPIRGIWICGTRADFVPGVVCNDCVIDGIDITSNKLEGSGIVLSGAYAMIDGDYTQCGNVVRNVNIKHNEILSADVPFQFEGCQIEGRIYDWNFGYPRHDKKWAEPITDDSTVTNVLTNNRAENITCTDNIIEGYRYRVKAIGATGHGHGIYTDNKVCGNIVFERNKFGTGENHVHVQGFVCDDFVRDNGGNEASKVFLQNK